MPTETQDPTREAAKCPFCGSATYQDTGRMALMVDDQVLVIEDVPARICKGCMEQFYDEDILFKVEQARGEKLSGVQPRRTVETPVYAWEDL